MASEFGVVIIGRNEGQRLVNCLLSLQGHRLVYVDSGSTDDSVAQSEKHGAAVVQLDMSLPFTAARARNAGVKKLLEQYPELVFVQFVDGDCQIASGWMDAALVELKAHPSLAAVCGRRREINRDGSLYNMFCDIEWDTPVGKADACGGDAMYRIAAFEAVGQFDETFIAGEEPELCYRLRRSGWEIKRIDQEMTKHDADMHRFKQWWKRSQRCGYAYALGALEHGADDQRYKVRQCLSVLFWAGVVPVTALLLSLMSTWTLLGLIVIYSYLGLKIYRYNKTAHTEFSTSDTALYSGFVVLQKFPELLGITQCLWQRILGQKMNIIEYK